MNKIKNRGVEDIMIVSVDGLTGFGDVIHAVFPKAEIRRLIYTTNFIENFMLKKKINTSLFHIVHLLIFLRTNFEKMIPVNFRKLFGFRKGLGNYAPNPVLV